MAGPDASFYITMSHLLSCDKLSLISYPELRQAWIWFVIYAGMSMCDRRDYFHYKDNGEVDWLVCLTQKWQEMSRVETATEFKLCRRSPDGNFHMLIAKVCLGDSKRCRAAATGGSQALHWNVAHFGYFNHQGWGTILSIFLKTCKGVLNTDIQNGKNKPTERKTLGHIQSLHTMLLMLETKERILVFPSNKTRWHT